MNKFYDDIQLALQYAVTKYGSIRKLAEAVNMNPSTVSKWLESTDKKPRRSPNLRELAPIMDIMSVRVLLYGLEPSNESSIVISDAEKDKTILQLQKDLLKMEGRLEEVRENLQKANTELLAYKTAEKPIPPDEPSNEPKKELPSSTLQNGKKNKNLSKAG